MKDKERWVKSVLEQYELRLVRYTMRWVPRPVAREIVQDAMMKLWQEDPGRLETRVRPWLFTVCRNAALDSVKRESRQQPLETFHSANSAADSSADPHLRLESKEAAFHILELLGQIPVVEQEVILLKVQEDLSYQEISEITGHSVSYVGVLIHTGISRLRELAKKSGLIKPAAFGKAKP